MKYLRSFETEADYSAYTQSQEYVTPNVCLIEDEQTVVMNKYVPVEPQVPNNEIWYTSTDGNVVEMCSTTGFGANYISNVYSDGKGIITFDGDITTIGVKAFYENNLSRAKKLLVVKLPNSITNIADYAFFGCLYLQEINIHSNITSIGGYAFQTCKALTSITLPDSITYIGSFAFYNCENLVKFNFPSGITYIYANVLNGTPITSITIPYGVVEIQENAFINTHISSITIPDSVRNIRNYAFSNTRLETLTLPSGITAVGVALVKGCTSLTSVTLSDSITIIGAEAFSGCCSLSSITIPSGVTNIGSNTFKDCTQLATITYNNTQSQWAQITKANKWNTTIIGKTVHCTDGDIVIT